MVRLIPVERAGKTVWVEDAPTACGNGHADLVPAWGQCPVETCRAMVRLWRCRTAGCADVLVDDEHEHRPVAPPSAASGG